MTYTNGLLRTLASALIAFCLAVQAPLALAQATRYAALSDDLASSLCGMQMAATQNSQSGGHTGFPAGKSAPCPICQALHAGNAPLPDAVRLTCPVLQGAAIIRGDSVVRSRERTPPRQTAPRSSRRLTDFARRRNCAAIDIVKRLKP